MKERARCGPGPPLLLAALTYVRARRGCQDKVAALVCGSFALLGSFPTADHIQRSRRLWQLVWSTQTEKMKSWHSLDDVLGAAAGAPSSLLECTSPMTWPSEPAAVEEGSARHYLVSRGEGKARFQEVPFAIPSSRGKERAPPCTAEANAPPQPG